MIAVLLELAREGNAGDTEQATIALIVEEIMLAFQEQTEKNGKALSLHMTSHKSEKISRVNGLIVMGNLVRNAIQHSTGADIELCVADNAFRITNTLQDTQQHSVELFSGVEQGFGLGKIIVERICHQQNWHYTLRVEAGKITATIRFLSHI
ncbi:hypothetical protein CWB98_12225 [Pseudoalteromonas rubra]|uniref:Histidine kinase/HSP90-like ATPase domain-containing protein n=1 Tax=Pseudoalteromonas rubra TaxID=43658 RepID=A0A5S3X0M8_9GAMM|nr:hypothetical protein CWB98_12225 [Pseudoalteromonas rubra]